VPFWLLALFILQFFRDPPREVPDDPLAVVSPADGRIVWVGKSQDPYLKREALKVSVFMNVFNVHSNRSPVDGVVKERWYFPGSFLNAALDKAWAKMTGKAPCKPRDISIKGRVLHVPCSAQGVARFSFADICEKPLAASDYLRLAHDYHTIMIDRIPVMDYPERNAAKRFIALIDTLYDNAVKLMASAQADPLSLYLATEGHEANEFKRTSSRLIEMSSESYLALPHGHKDSAASGSSTGLVET